MGNFGSGIITKKIKCVHVLCMYCTPQPHILYSQRKGYNLYRTPVFTIINTNYLHGVKCSPKTNIMSTIIYYENKSSIYMWVHVHMYTLPRGVHPRRE